MSEKLPLAIEAIKAGNKQIGQQLLAQALQADPNNEQAWLWMSTVVDEEKRKYCIDRVLAINPNNPTARKAFAELIKINNPQQTVKLESVSKPLSNPQSPEPSDLQLKKGVEKEKKSESGYKLIIRDSFSIGIICGILGIPIFIIFSLISIILLPTILTQLFVLFFIIFTGIATGVRLLRQGVNSIFGLTIGGATSGFISGAIWSLSIGLLFTAAYYPILNTSLYLLWCGFLIPLIFGVINAISVWLPRIFINPNTPDTPFSITKFARYFASKEGAKSNVVTIKDIPSSASGEKYWLNLEQDKNNAILFLSQKIIYGTILKSTLDFEEIISKGIIHNELFKDYLTINYNEINEVIMQGSEIVIQDLKSTDKNAIHLSCGNYQNASFFLNILQEKLGAKFEKSITPVDIKEEIKFPVRLLIGTVLSSFFLYFLIAGLSISQITSIFGKELGDQLIDFLFFLVHEGGILLIGGSVSILLLGAMIYRVLSASETIKLKAKEPSSEKIQRAISHIKKGEFQNGQRLLNLVLKDEPNNEAAWYWMSHVASANKKAFYLEKVLEINPNNQEALQGIQNIKLEEKMKQAELIEKEKTLNNKTAVEIPQQQTKNYIHESTIKKFWVYPARKETLLLIILDDNIIVAKSQKSSANKVQTELSLGNIPHTLLTEKTIIDFKNIKSIEESLNTIRIEFLDKSGKENSAKIESKNDAMTVEILELLENYPKVVFNRQVAPMSISRILLSNGIVLSIVTGVSIFFYFAALDIEKNDTTPTGSARTRGIINLLSLLGPGGVACIGGGIFILLVISLVASIVKPPTVTTLTPQLHPEMKE